MNLAGIIGIILSIGMIVYGMISDGGNIALFWNVPSVAITIGGTLAVLMTSFTFKQWSKIPKLLLLIFKSPKYDPKEYISQIVEYAKIARSKGLLALEDSANQCTDPFMKSSLMLIVDANEAEKVRAMLDDALYYIEARHDSARAFFEKGAALAPAFGMLGTLMGLINMLASLTDNPDGLAGGMSVALITTFYGSILANVLFTPVANRLQVVHNQEMLCLQIVVEGVLTIQSGANPRYIEDKLMIMLSNQEKNGKAGKAPKGKKAAEAVS